MLHRYPRASEFWKAIHALPVLPIVAGLPYYGVGESKPVPAHKRILRRYDMPKPPDGANLYAVHPEGGRVLVFDPGIPYTAHALLTLRRDNDVFMVEDHHGNIYARIPMPQPRATVFYAEYNDGYPVYFSRTWNFSVGGKDGSK